MNTRRWENQFEQQSKKIFNTKDWENQFEDKED